MHIDARNLEDGAVIESDLCIIGAGAAGISIARELANGKIDVCVIESGGLESGGPQELYSGSNVGLNYYPLDACRLRYFGGSTNHLSGWCAPLDPIDFEQRDWVPHSGWPLKYPDLLPYYKRAQKLFEIEEFAYTADYWTEKYDSKSSILFKPDRLRHKVYQLSPPTRFGKTYRKEIVNAANITVVTNANATELRTTANGKAISSLEIRTLNGISLKAKSSNYVLACGGIENARLLLLSDQHYPDGLGNENDLVGRFFMEHPRTIASTVIFRDRMWLESYRYRGYSNNNRVVSLGFSLRREEQCRHKTLNPSLRFQFMTSSYRSAMALYNKLKVQKFSIGSGSDGQIYESVERIIADFEGVAAGINKDLIGQNPDHTPVKAIGLHVTGEQAPNPNSRISLCDELDSLGQPKVQLNWELSDIDIHSIVHLNRVFAQELGRNGLGRLRLRESIQAVNNTKEWQPDLIGGNHHIGTTRMGYSSEDGVCDKNCKLFRCKNLYIAGSSVFPTGGGSPPTLTIVALALRLTDHLKSIHKS